MKKIHIAVLLLAVLIGGMLFEAARGDSTDSDGDRKVAATIFPLYDITREIAGDEFEVVLMLPAGASPHTFDPQPSLLKDLEGSEVVFSIGNGLDSWSESLVESIDAKQVVVDTGVDLRKSEDSHDEHSDDEHKEDGHEEHEEDEHGHDDEDEHHDDDDHEDGHDHGPIDPHYWLSVHNAEHIVVNIANELSEMDADNAELYSDRADAYVEQLEQLHTELEQKTIGLADKNIISLHDAWNYFAAEYGINIVGTFEPTGGEEPTPQYLASLQEEVRENNVATLFVEPQLSTSSVTAFASDNNLSIALIDPLGGVDGRNSYIDLMRYNVEQVVSALSN